jgi:hypothetical protein
VRYEHKWLLGGNPSCCTVQLPVVPAKPRNPLPRWSLVPARGAMWSKAGRFMEGLQVVGVLQLKYKYQSFVHVHVVYLYML